MVDVVEPIQLTFVVLGVPFEALNSLLDCSPEPGTDLEILLGRTLSMHGEHLSDKKSKTGEFRFCRLKYFLSLPILTKHGSQRQITALQRIGDGVSENRTVSTRTRAAKTAFGFRTVHDLSF
ncbi:MAG: hypothetical protein WBC92_11105 [Terracidiphilus sp.]